jgi:formate hydrogenlyase subunit 5
VIALQERSVDATALASAIERAGGRLMMLFVVPVPGGGDRELCALVDDGGSVLRLRAQMHGDAYRAITPRVPAAHWFEREIHDLTGITPAGHPRLEPLVRHGPDEGEV